MHLKKWVVDKLSKELQEEAFTTDKQAKSEIVQSSEREPAVTILRSNDHPSKRPKRGVAQQVVVPKGKPSEELSVTKDTNSVGSEPGKPDPSSKKAGSNHGTLGKEPSVSTAKPITTLAKGPASEDIASRDTSQVIFINSSRKDSPQVDTRSTPDPSLPMQFNTNTPESRKLFSEARRASRALIMATRPPTGQQLPVSRLYEVGRVRFAPNPSRVKFNDSVMKPHEPLLGHKLPTTSMRPSSRLDSVEGLSASIIPATNPQVTRSEPIDKSNPMQVKSTNSNPSRGPLPRMNTPSIHTFTEANQVAQRGCSDKKNPTVTGQIIQIGQTSEMGQTKKPPREWYEWYKMHQAEKNTLKDDDGE